MYPAQVAAKKKRESGFTVDQERLILKEARRVFDTQFKDKPSAQVNFGKALGNLSQPSVSALLAGTYTPGIRRAEYLAQLAGYKDLKDMIGPYIHHDEHLSSVSSHGLPNLERCVEYWGHEHWPRWVVAAAREGYYGDTDVTPAEWAARLDKLAKK